MNQYKKLMSNTVIFAIGTFSSKLLVFFMTRYYTSVLTQSDFGISSTITQASNILLPIASVAITDAVIRFGLEQHNSKKNVFTIGFISILIGFIILLPFAPLVSKLGYLGEYTALMYAYVFAANLQSLCGQCVRARGHVRLYAIDGIFRTITTIILNVIFLSAFEMGITGYILSVIVSNFISVALLVLIDRLNRFIDIKAVKKKTVLQMLRYSLPLIPNKICVFIYSSADSFFILYMVSAEANGLYSAAHKIPTMLILISGIFIEAMQISTFSDIDKVNQQRFLTKIANAYQSFVFIVASGIIMFSKLAMSIIAAPDYYEGWKFIPLLIFASSFACLSNFQNIIYSIVKKSSSSLTTTLVGVSINITLNFILVPRFGASGAAFATLIAYIAMFLIRAIDTQKYIRVQWNVRKFAISFVLLSIQSFLILLDGQFWVTQQLALFIAISYIVSGDLIKVIRKLFFKK